jgi:hypothetical protein
MSNPHTRSFADYSPHIAMELELHGQRFNVAAIGPDSIRLRDARPMPPGQGTVRLTVGDNLTILVIDLHDGIVVDRRGQAYTLINQIEGAAA